MSTRSMTRRRSGCFALLGLVLSAAGLAGAGELRICDPCLAFDHLDRQIRDGRLPRAEARRQFAQRIAELDALSDDSASRPPGAQEWLFPLHGHTPAESAAGAAKGYVAAGYDYFDGNRHGGHPSYDLFITDRDQDSLDDRTGQPVTVLSLTGGFVVAAEPAWDAGSGLRGGRYLWVYDPAEHLLVYYAHNRELLVRVGDRVEPGTPLATVGRSGLNAWKQRSPTHLHLTVLKVVNGLPQPLEIASRLGKLPPRP